MRTITAIIADDEPPARQYLRLLLSEFPEVRVVRECADGRDTLSAIDQLRPELVFLDAQMPELDGFAVLENLEPMALPAVIFVTAYDAFALRAFEVHALDYLLKPFTRARFQAAMAHTLERLAQPKQDRKDSRMAALLAELRLNRRGCVFCSSGGDRLDRSGWQLRQASHRHADASAPRNIEDA